MKKRVFGRTLSRERSSRRALFRALTRSLIEHGAVKTTKAKAKAVQPFVDRLVKTAKNGSDADKRRVYAILGNDKKSAKEVLEMVKKVFKKRESGFTRAVPLGSRKGDRAKMVRLEFVEKVVVSDPKRKRKHWTRKGLKELKQGPKKKNENETY